MNVLASAVSLGRRRRARALRRGAAAAVSGAMKR